MLMAMFVGAKLDSAHVILSNAQVGDELLVSGSMASSGTVNGLAYTVTTVGGQITVTLSGNATLAAYDVALKDITFNNSLGVPSGVDRLITVSVTNATFGTTSNEAVSTIHVILNDAPVNVLPATYIVNEDTSVNRNRRVIDRRNGDDAYVDI